MRQRIRPRLSYANVTATLALFVALGGTTYAATGGNFILGRSNSASSTTSLSSSGSGPALSVRNTSTGTAGSFNVTAGHPPLTVNSGAKVVNLNADKLDGKDSSAFLDRCSPAFVTRHGRTCAGSDGVARSFYDSISYCAEAGLRLPSLSEAMTLASLFDVPGVSGTDYFWTDAIFFVPSDSNEYAYVVSDAGSTFATLTSDATPKTVCVGDPSND